MGSEEVAPHLQTTVTEPSAVQVASTVSVESALWASGSVP